ncbi:cytochrome c [Castellaniella sp. MT123]|uniref:c-type cytochrome n=1 Tax=Castellaniella sp. MT123 TaxID=3140381 RepID=UPI0031F387F4
MSKRRITPLRALLMAAGLTAGLVIAATWGLAWQRRPEPPAHTDLALDDPALIRQGEYIARTADCIACHTAPGGKPYAGGLAMQTPAGAIYSTNITPDPDTGIGAYDYEAFRNAVKHGIRRDGAALYPAMPYPSYAIMPEADLRALYAYFMKAVAPQRQANAKSTIPWPLNMRWPLIWWQALFAPTRTFQPAPELDANLNRGKYLVEGPGHCGACHTPRGIGFQETALNLQDGDTFLSGALIDGWRAKSLRGEAQGLHSWSQAEIIEFLASGRTNRVAAFGAMADVVSHSTRHMTAEDLGSMAAYLKQLPPAPGKLAAFAPKRDTLTESLLDGTERVRGALLYREHCMSCHRPDGQGVPRIFPALDGNSAIFAHNPQSTIQVTLEGGRMPLDPRADKMAFAMPGFSHLSDQDISEVLSFVRSGWTNQAPAVTPEQVREIRAFLATKAPHIQTGEHQ